jgi:nucleoside-diphosphate-sugar epimerase
MRVLITGSNGFIGSNIIKKLSSNKCIIYSLPKDCENIKDIVIGFNPDIIVHCGWYGGNNYIDTNSPNQFYKNINYSVELIEALTEMKKKTKFIGFGSFAEYGPKNCITKEYEQEQPTDLYGLSKYTFKQYSELVCEQNNIDWAWVRPCYVYGPGDVSTRLIPTIIKKFINNEDVTLDECDKYLDYIYIDDFINMFYSIIKLKLTGVYNICSGNQYRLKDVINLVHNISNSDSVVTFDPQLNRESSFHYICGDNTKIKENTNLEPKISLETGLKKTIKYYEKLGNN